MSGKRKLAIIAHDVGGPGGMESHLEEVISRLKHDYEVIVVAASMNLKDRTGVRFVRIPVPKRPVPLKLVMFAILASIRLLFLKRDVLQTTGAIVFNRADISTVHFCIAGYRQAAGEARDGEKRSFLRRLNDGLVMKLALLMEKLVYKPKRTRRLVAVSNRVREELLDSFPYAEDEVRVIPNGVDVHTFYPYSASRKQELRIRFGVPEQGRILTFMGGDWHRKGLAYVVDAFNQVAGEFPDLFLLVVGKGDAAHYASRLSPAHRHRAHFAGSQPNPWDWLGMSDVFICPTSYETFSLAAHEAAASGLTVISTKVGGVEDLIEHAVNGFYIERNAASIETTLRQVLGRHEDCRGDYGYRARAKVMDLTWDHTYRKMSALIAQSIEQPVHAEARQYF